MIFTYESDVTAFFHPKLVTISSFSFKRGNFFSKNLFALETRKYLEMPFPLVNNFAKVPKDSFLSAEFQIGRYFYRVLHLKIIITKRMFQRGSTCKIYYVHPVCLERHKSSRTDVREVLKNSKLFQIRLPYKMKKVQGSLSAKTLFVHYLGRQAQTFVTYDLFLARKLCSELTVTAFYSLSIHYSTYHSGPPLD